MAQASSLRRRIARLQQQPAWAPVKRPRAAGVIAIALAATTALGVLGISPEETANAASPSEWVDDLSAISSSDWSYDRAAHLLERAGFGGTPEEIEKLAKMSPQEAVNFLVDYEAIDVSHLPEYEESDIYPHGYKYIPFRAMAAKTAAEGGAFGDRGTPRRSAAVSAGRQRVLQHCCGVNALRCFGAANGGPSGC